MLPGLSPRPSGRKKAPPLWTYLGHRQGASGSSPSFSAFIVPRDGLMVVGILGNFGTSYLASGTIGGVAAAKLTPNTSGWGNGGIITREVAAGSYAVTGTYSGGNNQQSSAFAYLLEDYDSPTPVDVGYSNTNSNVVVNTVNVDMFPGTVGLFFNTHGSLRATAWTNAVEQDEQQFGKVTRTTAVREQLSGTDLNLAVSTSWSSNSDLGAAIMGAVWGGI